MGTIQKSNKGSSRNPPSIAMTRLGEMPFITSASLIFLNQFDVNPHSLFRPAYAMRKRLSGDCERNVDICSMFDLNVFSSTSANSPNFEAGAIFHSSGGLDETLGSESADPDFGPNLAICHCTRTGVSTSMRRVLFPCVITPADVFQMIVGTAFGSPPAIFAVNVTRWPSHVGPPGA